MTTQSNRTKGIACILLAAFGFSCMSVFVRLSGDLPTYQKVFFRNFIALLVALGMMKKNHVHYKMEKEHLWPLFARAALGTAGILCNFYAIDNLLLADANMLTKLSPFSAIVFSFFLLKEKVKPTQLLFVLAAFLGCTFVAKPTFDFAETLPALVALVGGIVAGGAYTYIRVLGTHGVPGPVIVVAFSGFSCLACLPLILLNYTPMSAFQLLMLLIAGCAASVGQFCMTAAYRFAPAKEISAFDYTQVIFTAILGFVVFHQVPDVWSFVGYAIITAAGVAMAVYNNRLEKKAAQK